MEDIQRMRAVQDLLRIVQEYAPNGKSQAQVVQDLHAMQREIPGYTDAHIKHLAGVLLDGLKFGNWPWIKFSGFR
jgi:hypothetical protein